MADFRALFIDDEEELVSAMVERLSYRGVMADYVISGAEALVKIRQNDYSVVVLDLKMPGMGGAEVLRVINREFPGLPVFLITGHGVDESDKTGLPEGAFDYISKPIDLEILLKKMKEAAKNG